MLNHRSAGLGSAGIQIAFQSWPWPNQVFAISNHRFLFLLVLPCLGGGRPRVPSVTSPPRSTESEAPSLPARGRPECPREGAVWQREAVPGGGGQSKPMRTHSTPGSRQPRGRGAVTGEPSCRPIHPLCPCTIQSRASPGHHSYRRADRPERRLGRGNGPQISIFLPSTQRRLLSFCFLKPGERERRRG